jgi:hypothetical protein
MKIKLFCWSIFFLFGTFLHECSHFAFAGILGKTEGFSIVPKREGDAFIFGKVRARVRYRVLSVFVAAAPLMWWALLVLMLKPLLSSFHGVHLREDGIAILSGRLKPFSLQNVFALWLVSQLLWAGRLSLRDIETCLRGLLSPSGLILSLSVLLLFQLFSYVR